MGRPQARAAVAAWDRFWFAPQSVSTLAVVRIAFALVVLGWTAAVGHDLFAFYSRNGLLPEQQDLDQVVGSGAWGPLGTFTSDTALVVTYVALSSPALLLLVGLKTRVAAVVVFVGLMALTRRNIWVLDSGDPLLRSIAFFLVLAPSGDALSLDRRLAVRRGRAELRRLPAARPMDAAPAPAPAERPLPVRGVGQGRRRDMARRHRGLVRAQDREPRSASRCPTR